MLEHVLFAIDDGDDLHTQAKFLRHVDTLRATSKMKGIMYSGIGCYNGVPERCYMVLGVDFDNHFNNLDYLKDQECVLRVPGDTRQPCTIQYPSGKIHSVGPMLCYNDTVPQGDYTYMNGKYWVIE
jgi:hypothetical protein